MKFTQILAAGLILTATASLAHQGVQNATVKARMDGMSSMAANMKSLGLVAKGATPFDANLVRAAVQSIAQHAGQSADLFRSPETDPVSEALPAIWQDFDDFTAKATDLQVLAQELSTSISQPHDIAPAMAALGGACKSCHEKYRE